MSNFQLDPRSAGIILSIIIPTYNRADYLERLLSFLEEQSVSYKDSIQLIIGNNASTDGTEIILNNFQKRWPEALIFNRALNVGMDENFCSCFDFVAGKYYWIIGDDDLPVRGIFDGLLNLLLTHDPDLIYMRSEWCSDISNLTSSEHSINSKLNFTQLNSLSFARSINVWSTFISGMIIKKKAVFKNNSLNTRVFSGTFLSHLYWVLLALKNGNNFIYISDKCIIATAASSGGYRAIEVFGINFNVIVDYVFGKNSRISRAMIKRNILFYLPMLVWNIRFSKVGNFDKINTQKIFNSLKGYKYFWFFCAPALFLPKYLSLIFVRASEILAKFFNRI